MKANQLSRSWDEQFKYATASIFLFLLLVADGAFISLHYISQVMPSLDGLMFSVETDRGYPEFFQYTKELLIIVLLLILSIRARSAGFLIWTLLFIYLLLDNALQIHEIYGLNIAEGLKFSPFAGLRSRDFGEFVVSGICAATFLTLLSWFYIRGSDAFGSATRHLLLLLVALAFFGIFVDMAHVAFSGYGYVNELFGVVEAEGEMVVMSFITWYVFLLNVRAKVGDPSERY